MEPNYEILEIDIYGDLRKQDPIELARKYNINIPENPDDNRTRDLRQTLSITKLAHRLAKSNKDAEFVLKRVLNKLPLNQIQVETYPDIQKFAQLLQPIYDIPELNEQQPTYENIHLPKTPPLDLLPYPIQSPRSEHIYTELKFDNHPQPSPTHQPSTDNRDQQTTVICQSDNQTSTIQNQHTNMSQERENKPLVKTPTFSGLDSENCQEFLEKFELAAKINGWKQETKIDLFETHLVNLPYKWFQIYKKENRDPINWNDLKTEFSKTFSPIALIDDAEYLLENRLQNADETPTKCLFEITYLCQKVDVNMPEKKIIDYVINGLQPKFCNELLRMDNSTLNELRNNILKIEKQIHKQCKNSRRYHVKFDDEKILNAKIIKHTSTTEPTFDFEDRLQKIEQAICNINVRSQNRKGQQNDSDTDESYDRGYKRRPRNESPSRWQYGKELQQKGEMTRPSDNKWHRRDLSDDRKQEYNERSRKDRNYKWLGETNNNYHTNRYESKRDSSSERFQERKPTSNHSAREFTPKENYSMKTKTRYRENSRDKDQRRRYCHICAMSNHNTSECGFNLKNTKKADRKKPLPCCEHCLRNNHTSDECYRKKSKNVPDPAAV